MRTSAASREERCRPKSSAPRTPFSTSVCRFASSVSGGRCAAREIGKTGYQSAPDARLQAIHHFTTRGRRSSRKPSCRHHDARVRSPARIAARTPCPPAAQTDPTVPNSNRPDLTKAAASARESVQVPEVSGLSDVFDSRRSISRSGLHPASVPKLSGAAAGGAWRRSPDTAALRETGSIRTGKTLLRLPSTPATTPPRSECLFSAAARRF